MLKRHLISTIRAITESNKPNLSNDSSSNITPMEASYQLQRIFIDTNCQLNSAMEGAALSASLKPQVTPEDESKIQAILHKLTLGYSKRTPVDVVQNPELNQLWQDLPKRYIATSTSTTRADEGGDDPLKLRELAKRTVALIDKHSKGTILEGLFYYCKSVIAYTLKEQTRKKKGEFTEKYISMFGSDYDANVCIDLVGFILANYKEYTLDLAKLATTSIFLVAWRDLRHFLTSGSKILFKTAIDKFNSLSEEQKLPSIPPDSNRTCKRAKITSNSRVDADNQAVEAIIIEPQFFSSSQWISVNSIYTARSKKSIQLINKLQTEISIKEIVELMSWLDNNVKDLQRMIEITIKATHGTTGDQHLQVKNKLVQLNEALIEAQSIIIHLNQSTLQTTRVPIVN